MRGILLIVLIGLTGCSSLNVYYEFHKNESIESAWVEYTHEANSIPVFKFQNNNVDITIYVNPINKLLTQGFKYLPIFPIHGQDLMFRQDRIRIRVKTNQIEQNLDNSISIKLDGKQIRYRTKLSIVGENTIEYYLYFYTDIEYLSNLEINFSEDEDSEKRLKIPNLLLRRKDIIKYREFFAH